jgi:FkbM family methyltransferase
LGLPHTVTNKEYNACAYTAKVHKFGKMMMARGHEIIHYGHEDSDLECTEHVTVTRNKDLKKAYGNYDWRRNFYKFDINDHAYQTFYKNAIREVSKRKRKNDFILPFWGSGVRSVCDAHPDVICVEPGIGYAGGHWARWKVFESYSIFHAYYGIQAVGNCRQDWYDVVIPNYFDPEDFDFQAEKDDYFLFLGRVYSGKGIDVAIQATEATGNRLIIAGQNPENLTFPPHVEFVGYADVESRRRLMSHARGAFVPSMYLEPFGGVQIEMLMSGTPTITTDWGSFTENNLHGVTGYRCRTFDQFCWAAENIQNINPRACRGWAENFTLDRVAPMYEEYFQMVMDVHTNQGWYQRHTERNNMDWLKKSYPTSSIPVDPARKKFFFDCGTHLFQGFHQFREKIRIKKDWKVYCFESNPDVFEKSQSEYDLLTSQGYDITHKNVAVSDTNGKVKVNRILHDGEYIHLGSNILDDPPTRDIKWNDDFKYAKNSVEVDCVRLSDVIRDNCKKEDLVIVKLDIEGSEFKVLDDIIASETYKLIDKIYVEYHSRFFENHGEYDEKIKYYSEFFKDNGVHIQTDGDDVVWTI